VRTAERRAAELVAARGHERAVVDVGLYRHDAGMREVLEASSFAVATSFIRMYVAVSDATVVPDPPQGVEIRRLGADESELRTLHTVLEESFADHFGHVRNSFDEFRDRLANAERSGIGGSDQRWLAFLAGAPVGLVMGNDSYVEDENAGHVQMLGVVREARGRGIGRQLLLTAFDDSRRRGRVGVYLGVDTNNVTSALRLYESVGMHPVHTIDVWRKATSTR
jgi:ribosomal protein S18 acetylase RimI-like enzyme